MTDLKLGFIGFGKHARVNLYPSLKILGYPLAAVATMHEETAGQAATEYTIPSFYTDHQELLQKEKLDAVFICAQPGVQKQLVVDVLRAGCHVFVEKPLGTTLAEAQEVADVSKQTGHGRFYEEVCSSLREGQREDRREGIW